ncbi:catechol 2,3-dioxygenase-like lactoylglutathione lyase family enzyme [Natronospira proteinivora]|uniref:Catechol 2,3-dioxygenase-like lactoylglutathione lyase family enzyme n=1 Tax=Natronospira proteinivora TaxID=1807133 RepID=A0ABT1G5R8_9GAMM|nr:VOC family protein [Natronospira proteinivora]MCP1726641.1 catechol 2,3-dioxygenase-like lactoylglutathione lyase family enzyme [Natronospira proteinivora]
MAQRLRFAHVNLVARDWRRLADFYERALGCTPLPPERDYAGRELERGTGIPGARLRGVHLRLPGYEEGGGPTLEIFQYDPQGNDPPRQVNRTGFGHICFQVGNVEQAREAILNNGGQPVGDVVTLSPSVSARVTWCYLSDPEGNIIELQRWSPFGFRPASDSHSR